jgi:hypothetical protein
MKQGLDSCTCWRSTSHTWQQHGRLKQRSDTVVAEQRPAQPSMLVLQQLHATVRIFYPVGLPLPSAPEGRGADGVDAMA